MIDPEQLQAHAARIRASGVLGRSELMQRLFDFFVESSLAGKTPKEIEIAIDVFGKDTEFEVTQDAMVRVYVHKLRRKLEEYYAGVGGQEVGRFVIPRGEYRLLYEQLLSEQSRSSNFPVSDADETSALITSQAATQLASEVPAALATETSHSTSDDAVQKTRTFNPPIWMRWSMAAIAALLIANLVVLYSSRVAPSYTAQELSAVRNNPLWHNMVADTQPIYIVVGDYYIFGELDQPSEANPESVRRLVRDFNINSRSDLEQLIKERPELADRYMDLALSYLPISAAFALHNVIPLIEPNRKNPRQVQMILASELTPAMIRSSHIIYIGLLSGMGTMLRDIAFAGSQFKIGDTYDELIDRKTNRSYVSQSSISVNDNTRYRDYGYFATFAGPSNNRIVILAGTRDVALMHTAEAVSHADSLKALMKRAGTDDNFEALYAVDAIDRTNLDGQLLLADKLNTADIWTSNATVASVATSTNAPPTR